MAIRVLIVDDSAIVRQIFSEELSSDPELEVEGTGLGLAIAQTIAKRHGGSIRATSEEGEGTCFHLTFPTFLKN